MIRVISINGNCSIIFKDHLEALDEHGLICSWLEKDEEPSFHDAKSVFELKGLRLEKIW